MEEDNTDCAEEVEVEEVKAEAEVKAEVKGNEVEEEEEETRSDVAKLCEEGDCWVTSLKMSLHFG